MTSASVAPLRVGDEGKQHGISFSNCAHFLKLRQNWRASHRFRVELGLDYDVKKSLTKPWAGVRLLLDDRADSWAVEINTDWALVQTPKLDLLGFTDRLTIPVDARLGRDHCNGGQPHVELGLHNPYLAAGLLLVSLAANVPVHLKRKEAGGLSASLPIKFKSGREVPHEAQGRAEVDATLERRGRGLHLAFHQLNGVLRLYQK